LSLKGRDDQTKDRAGGFEPPALRRQPEKEDRFGKLFQVKNNKTLTTTEDENREKRGGEEFEH